MTTGVPVLLISLPTIDELINLSDWFWHKQWGGSVILRVIGPAGSLGPKFLVGLICRILGA